MATFHLTQSRESAILAANAQAAELLLRSLDWQAVLPEILELIGNATQLDRVYIYRNVEVTADDVLIDMPAEWTSDAIPSSNITTFQLKEAGFYDWYAIYRRNETIVHLTTELAGKKKASLEEAGIKSMASVPIFVKQTLWGVIGFSDYQHERRWQRGEVDSLKLLAAMLGAAIERQHLQKDMAKSARLENFGHLSAGISHDFKNILASIKLQTHLLDRSDNLPEKALYHLERIKSAANKGKQLTEQLLALATGKNNTTFGPINIHTLLLENVRLLAPPPASPVLIKADLDAEDCVIIGNRNQLQQVMMNLIINALEAMQDNNGSLLSIRTENAFSTTKANPLRDTDQLQAKSHLHIIFKDNGPGMTPDIQKRIFAPFFTTKTTGYGLGLSATRGYVLDHNGTISVNSQLGHGTTFSLIFKTVNQPAAHT